MGHALLAVLEKLSSQMASDARAAPGEGSARMQQPLAITAQQALLAMGVALASSAP